MPIPGSAEAEQSYPSSKTPAFVFALLLILSIPLRLIHLDAPLTGEHEFRQTQTALSVWAIREHGISWLHPKLPLFGPPWECPFEYPVFQIAAAAVDTIAPWNNLDLSIRVTNVLFFYLTAVALYLLARLLFTGPVVALLTSAVFLLAPYNLAWSRTSMIEYAATFFSLTYLLCFLRWTMNPTRTVFATGLCFGVLASLTKITTFILPLFICGILAGLCIWKILRSRTASVATESNATDSRSKRRLNAKRILPLCLLLGVPLAAGDCYIKFGDRIKEQNPYTAWLTSKHPYTRGWTYGTLDQRLTWRKWEVILFRMAGTVLPYSSLFLVTGFVWLPFWVRGFETLPAGNFWIGAGLALAPLFGVLLLFNLYWVHSYYFIACAPFLALFTGLGFCALLSLVRNRFIKLLVLLGMFGLWLQDVSPQASHALYLSGSDPRISYLSEASKAIPRDEPVIIVSSTEWSGFAPYYLKRRAFMAMLNNKPVNIEPLLKDSYFKKNGFHWLLIEGKGTGISEMANRIMATWKNAREIALPASDVSYKLYSLSDD